MHIDLRRRRQVGGHQHRRPVDDVEADDVLADDVDAVRIVEPVALEQLAVLGVVERGDVVAERVDPDVHHLVGIARHGHAPAVTATGLARDGEILQPLVDEREHLLAAVLRLDQHFVTGDQVAQSILVGGEAEEVVLLVDPLRLGAVDRAALVDQLLRLVEALALDAVEPLVMTGVDVAVGGDHLPQLLRAGRVARVGAGPDEIVSREMQRTAQRLEPRRVAIDEIADGDALALGGLDVGEGVLVGAGEKSGVVAVLAVPAGEHVALDRLQREADVWLAVDVGDRRGDVKALLGHGGPPQDTKTRPVAVRGTRDAIALVVPPWFARASRRWPWSLRLGSPVMSGRGGAVIAR